MRDDEPVGRSMAIASSSADVTPVGLGKRSAESPNTVTSCETEKNCWKGPNHQEDDSQKNAPTLDWSFLEQGQLFGRQAEVEALQRAFHRHISPASRHSADANTKRTRELVLVSGQSGTGKTALVKTALMDLTLEKKGVFLMGKYDPLQGTCEPYSPFVSALTQLALHLETNELLVESIGLEACHVLCALAPALGKVLGIHQEEVTLKTHDAQQDRLKVALLKLFQFISEPVLFVIDDLQWADHASLNLLEALIVANAIPGFLVVGVCRSNEVPWHHDFAGMLRRLEDEQETTITHIQVQNLTVEATNDLLSNMLNQPPELCQPLAVMVHENTVGNAFFILQFLKTLQREGVLVAEENNNLRHQWLWDDAKWDSLSVCKSNKFTVVDLLSNQLRQLPKSCQELLQVACCVGATFEEAVVSIVLGRADIAEDLALAVRERMIQRQDSGSYAFCHDRIQQAAYALIREEDQPMSHVIVGRSLLQQLSPEGLEGNTFLVVNQLIRGMSLLTTEEDKLGLSQLCLKAGKKALQASDFEAALRYFDTGIELLPNRHWRDEYHVSMDLFCSKAEAQCCQAMFEEMDATIDTVLDNCRTPKDKIRSYQTKIYSLSMRTEFQAAMNLGLDVLAMLGERFPSKLRLIYLIPEFVKIKKRLKAKSDNDILCLPPVEDRDKSTAMNILNLVMISSFCADPEFFPFLSLRWVQLTLEYGLTDISGLSFSCYGILLCAVEEFKEAFRYVMLGKRLMDRYQSSRAQTMPRLYHTLYGIVYPWIKPMRSTFDGLELAITAAIDVGDFECAAFSAYSAHMNAFAAGETLSMCEDKIARYAPLMRTQRGPWFALTLLQQQALASLTGKSETPLHLELHLEVGTTNTNKFEFQLYEGMATYTRLLLAYHFDDNKLALRNAKASRGIGNVVKGNFVIVTQAFYDGMAVLAAAHHKTGWQRYQLRLQAQKDIKRLKKFGEIGPDNILHKLYILRGELQALKGDLQGAMEWFHKAIEHSKQQQAMDLEALANERAAIAIRRLGSGAAEPTANAEMHILKAIELYGRWGAYGVVSHLQKKHNIET